ncbi:MAG: 16S rRNA (cytosine(967)-C(5))-methyltransferase RsmB [Eubacteriales bacterium]|nr:16S rRNA (cytosine(967)-C(5))-methyltransferase RsmB [Eubacteriales bacterium]
MSREQAAGDGKKPEKTAQGRAVTDEREAVLIALLSYEKKQTFSNVLVKKTLDACGHMTDTERAFIKRLLEGVIERRQELDDLIRQYTGRSVSRLHPVVRQILRMGIYQILYMDAVPASAACNEAVLAAKRHGPARLSGFVNGVLRNIARDAEKGTVRRDVRDGDAESRPVPEFRAAMPEWLAQMWTQQLGAAEADRLMAALMEIRPVSIRLCGAPDETERENLLSSLREAGVLVEKGRWHPDHYTLRRTADLRRLPGFSEGRWTVQDESSMLAVEAAGLRGGETVYDVCAAPGGKSFFAADRLQTLPGGGGSVHAFDLTRRKTDRIREGARRLRLPNIAVAERDARIPVPAEEEGAADVLLCDLPCSGLGVMGKKRDIKYRASREGIRSLRNLQREILTNAVRYLKKGGVLLYSTCTISRAENEDNAAWIEKELGLVPEDLSPYLPEGIPGLRGATLQLLPHVHGTDGFFIARFRREE